jgi:4-hydroxybenzoate polyprenyltransferase
MEQKTVIDAPMSPRVELASSDLAGDGHTAAGRWLLQLPVVVGRELRFYYNTVRYDLSATMIPAMLFSLAAFKSAQLPTTELLPTLGRSALYFFLYALTFCLPNQITGLDEDRQNKPDRPLPRGEVTLKGAQVRWIISMVAYTAVGWWLGVLAFTVLWQVVTGLHNLKGWSKNWFGKDFSMGLGTLAELGAAWQMVTPITPTGWRWILLLSFVVFSLVPLQDLRDVRGDTVAGRRTFPIVFGDKATRYFLAAGFLALTVATHLLLMMPLGLTPAVIACDLVVGACSMAIAVRVLLLRSEKADHTTYMMFTYWYCLALGSAVILF